MPVVGLAGRLYLAERVSIEGELSGLPAGSRGHVWELDGRRARCTSRTGSPSPVGWRRLALEGRNDRDYLKLGLSKWTFGVEISL